MNRNVYPKCCINLIGILMMECLFLTCIFTFNRAISFNT